MQTRDPGNSGEGLGVPPQTVVAHFNYRLASRPFEMENLLDGFLFVQHEHVVQVLKPVVADPAERFQGNLGPGHGLGGGFFRFDEPGRSVRDEMLMGEGDSHVGGVDDPEHRLNFSLQVGYTHW